MYQQFTELVSLGFTDKKNQPLSATHQHLNQVDNIM